MLQGLHMSVHEQGELAEGMYGVLGSLREWPQEGVPQALLARDVRGGGRVAHVQADSGASGVHLMGVQTMKWMCRGLPWPLQWGPGAGGRRGDEGECNQRERGGERILKHRK